MKACRENGGQHNERLVFKKEGNNEHPKRRRGAK